MSFYISALTNPNNGSICLESMFEIRSLLNGRLCVDVSTNFFSSELITLEEIYMLLTLSGHHHVKLKLWAEW